MRNAALLFAVAGAAAASGRVFVSEAEIRLFVLAAGTVQLILALRFWFVLAARRNPGPPLADPPPSLAVIVPCAGDDPEMEAGARAVLDQDYPGRSETLFVVPSEEDPAYETIRRVVDGAGGRARLLTAGGPPARTNAKIFSMLRGVERIGAETEIVLFADLDLGPDRLWAASLAAALGDPGVGCSTSFLVYTPPVPSLWAYLRLFWMGAGYPLFTASPVPWAGSMAFRRKDFERLELARIWSRSFNEEGPALWAVRKAGMRTAFVPRAIGRSREVPAPRAMFDQLDRWIWMGKLYLFPAWMLGGLALGARACVYAAGPSMAILWTTFDAAYMAAVFFALLFHLPDHFRDSPLPGLLLPGAAVLAAPAVLVMFAGNMLRSLLIREIRWYGLTYRVRGPFSVEVLGKGGQSPPVSRR